MLEEGPIVHSLVNDIDDVHFLVEIGILNLLVLVDVDVDLNQDLLIRLFSALWSVSFLVFSGRSARIVGFSQTSQLVGVDSDLLAVSSSSSLALKIYCEDSVSFKLLSFYEG